MIRLQSPRSKSAVGPEGNQQSECLKLAPFLKMLWGFIAMASPCGATSKESTCNVRDLGLIPALGRSLEKGKATHSSILAWRISWIYGVAWESFTLANGFISFVNHEYEIISPLQLPRVMFTSRPVLWLFKYFGLLSGLRACVCAKSLQSCPTLRPHGP